MAIKRPKSNNESLFVAVISVERFQKDSNDLKKIGFFMNFN